eukprot:1161930-Pelagomonas_calceolata.AAC.3
MAISKVISTRICMLFQYFNTCFKQKLGLHAGDSSTRAVFPFITIFSKFSAMCDGVLLKVSEMATFRNTGLEKGNLNALGLWGSVAWFHTCVKTHVLIRQKKLPPSAPEPANIAGGADKRHTRQRSLMNREKQGFAALIWKLKYFCL